MWYETGWRYCSARRIEPGREQQHSTGESARRLQRCARRVAVKEGPLRQQQAQVRGRLRRPALWLAVGDGSLSCGVGFNRSLLRQQCSPPGLCLAEEARWGATRGNKTARLWSSVETVHSPSCAIENGSPTGSNALGPCGLVIDSKTRYCFASPPCTPIGRPLPAPSTDPPQGPRTCLHHFIYSRQRHPIDGQGALQCGSTFVARVRCRCCPRIVAPPAPCATSNRAEHHINLSRICH